jgi:hypothetical protein
MSGGKFRQGSERIGTSTLIRWAGARMRGEASVVVYRSSKLVGVGEGVAAVLGGELAEWSRSLCAAGMVGVGCRRRFDAVRIRTRCEGRSC